MDCETEKEEQLVDALVKIIEVWQKYRDNWATIGVPPVPKGEPIALDYLEEAVLEGRQLLIDEYFPELKDK